MYIHLILYCSVDLLKKNIKDPVVKQILVFKRGTSAVRPFII